MPEQISKYPDVTLKVLKGAGAKCGEGVEPKILTQCPQENFCSLPTGEICVYGIEAIPQMTQISREELAAVVCPRDSAGPGSGLPLQGAEMALALVGVFLMGFLLRR